VWANPAVKNSDWYKDKQHLIGFKQFCQALEMDISSIKINDEWLGSLIGRELLVNIAHEEETVVNPESGTRVKTGTFREKIRNFKKVV